jgi:hypothetical protein
VRPWFIPLFRDPQRPLPAASGASTSIGAGLEAGTSSALDGTDEEVHRALSAMADNAALHHHKRAGVRKLADIATPAQPSKKRPRLE